MTDGWDAQAIVYAMTKSNFSHGWCSRIVFLFIGIISVRFMSEVKTQRYLFLTLFDIVPVFSSLTSHAGASEHDRVFRIGLDDTHFIAASVWGGGLLGIFIFFSKVESTGTTESVNVFKMVKRFSHFAMVSTGVLMLSGITQVYLMENFF